MWAGEPRPERAATDRCAPTATRVAGRGLSPRPARRPDRRRARAHLRDVTERRQLEERAHPPGVPRRADRARQPGPVPGPGRARAPRSRPHGRARRGALHRPRRLQGRQRHDGPRRRRRAAARGRRPAHRRLRAGDTAARLGGDEFAVLVEGATTPAEIEADGRRGSSTRLVAPFTRRRGCSTVSASIGVATTPDGASTLAELLRQADLALYVAKGAGKGQWRRYQAELHTAMLERLELRARAGAGGRPDAFVLQYQPIVDSETGALGRLRGAGALAPSPARAGPPGRLHRRGRGDRPHRAARRVGAATRAERPAALARGSELRGRSACM